MNPNLRKQIVREFPELAAGYHLPMMAEVVAVSDSPKRGGIHDNYRPRLAVDVVMITTDYKQTDIKLDAVPVSQMGGGDERGFFAMPMAGTIVELAWLNGSPERPFVRSVIGDRQALPIMDADTMCWQQSEDVKQSVDASGNLQRLTDQIITDQTYHYEQLAALVIKSIGNELKRITENSIEDIDGLKQIEATVVNILSSVTTNLVSLGSINQQAGEHITRSATKTIIDHAKENLEQSSDKSILHKATKNMEMIAAKVHLGTDTDNVLKLLSDFMQATSDGFTALALATVTCAAPGSTSSVPINAAAFTTATTTIKPLKTKLDSMTK